MKPKRKRQALLNKLSNINFLTEAWNQLSKSNKGSRGISGETIESFERDLKNKLQQISDELKKGCYKFSSFRAVAIDKTKEGDTEKKYRAIRIAEIKDRVVLKALAILIEQKLGRKFKLDNSVSFGYQKKIGVAHAIERMVGLYKSGRTVILEADIKKFFDNVNNRRLLEEKVFPALGLDDSVNQLLIEGLNQEIGNKEDLTDLELLEFSHSSDGIPQGSALSPLLSNICLSGFDQRMLKENFGLIRYADDFIVLCKDETEARRAYQIAKEEIEKLKLELHEIDIPNSKTKIVKPASQEFSFLSIRFDGNQLWPTPKKLEEFKEKVRYITNVEEYKDVLTILRKSNNLISGWLSSFHFCDVDRYFEKIDDFMNYQLFNALRHLNWELKSQGKTRFKYKIQRKNQLSSDTNANCLTPSQRNNSGVITCRQFFEIKMKERAKIDVKKAAPYEMIVLKAKRRSRKLISDYEPPF